MSSERGLRGRGSRSMVGTGPITGGIELTTIFELGRAVKRYTNAVEDGDQESSLETYLSELAAIAENYCIAKGVLPDESE